MLFHTIVHFKYIKQGVGMALTTAVIAALKNEGTVSIFLLGLDNNFLVYYENLDYNVNECIIQSVRMSIKKQKVKGQTIWMLVL